MNAHLTTLAMRQHLAHDNARMCEALTLIADMAETSTFALTMTDIARIACTALVCAARENPALRHPETDSDRS